MWSNYLLIFICKSPFLQKGPLRTTGITQLLLNDSQPKNSGSPLPLQGCMGLQLCIKPYGSPYHGYWHLP